LVSWKSRLDTQAKILRAVQEGTIDPLGASQSKAVNVRLIAATKQDLEQAAKQGKFREDLFYRLQVGGIRIPPLRERRSDIPLLSIHFLDEINAGLLPERRFKPEALHVICSFDWPGNVRQLRNTVQRAAVLARQGEIAVEHLSIPTSASADTPVGVPDIRVGFPPKAILPACGNPFMSARLILLEAIRVKLRDFWA
jgi:DNA-binding NtrC family response regulator